MKRLFKRYHCTDTAAAQRALREWYRLPLGQELLKTEQALLSQVLPQLFGYHLLQLGIPHDRELLAPSRIQHRMVLSDSLAAGRTAELGKAELLLGQSRAIPLDGDSLDVVVMPHSLAYEDDPHQVLREVERVLIPEGHVLILGFNPWGLWGGWRLALGWRQQVPWSSHFFSAARIKDWLALLGFDTIVQRSYFYRPPYGGGRTMKQLGFMERMGERWWPRLGGGYLLVARKRVTTLTPIRPRWRTRRKLLVGGLTEPSTRQGKC